MSDKPAGIRAITGAIGRLAGTSGLKKSPPVTSAGFQDLQKNSKIVEDILKISNQYDRSVSVAGLATDLGKLQPKDRSSVIDAAIENFRAEGRFDTWAATAIVSARHHLQPKHQSKLSKIVRLRPELNELIKDAINDLEVSKQSRGFLEDARRSRDDRGR